jgi:hypothetical protein
MNYRPLVLFFGSATLGYIAWTQRNAQAPQRGVEPPEAYRNRGLRFRPVGNPAEPYPDWVRGLKGKSGVYVIRELDENGEPLVVYVGESHTDKLYDTMTRHLQQWRRWKGFWKGQYGQGHDPGLTYDRDSVEVATRVVPPEEAIELEARLISKYSPRDNINGQVEEVDDVGQEDPPPF